MKDYANRVLLDDYEDRLQLVCLKMSRVSNAWRSYSCSTLKSYMHWLHLSHFQCGLLTSSRRSHQGCLIVKSTSWLLLIILLSGWRQNTMLDCHLWVASFIKSCIICNFEVPHHVISETSTHFRVEVDTYGIQHHKSSAYRPPWGNQ